MRATARMIDQVTRALPIIAKLPEGTFFQFEDVGAGDEREVGVMLICMDQAAAREILSALPQCFWKKEYNQKWNHWTFTGRVDGVKIRITGMSDTPPTCRLEYDEVKTFEEVPVRFEKREVIKKVARVVCDPEPEAEESLQGDPSHG